MNRRDALKEAFKSCINVAYFMAGIFFILVSTGAFFIYFDLADDYFGILVFIDFSLCLFWSIGVTTYSFWRDW